LVAGVQQGLLLMMNIMKSEKQEEFQNGFPVMKKIVNFLTAGLVDYSDVDDGKYLLRKEAIDRMLPTLEGRPLVIGHQKIDPDHLEDIAVGYITKGYWNPETGSFDCDVLVKDPEILNPEHNAVSCAYVATEFGEGGRYSGIEYDAEILNGNFTHIALVETPRYNDAKILVNGINKGKAMIKRFFSNAAGAEDEKKSEDEEKKENEDGKSLNPDDVVMVGEDEVTVKDLIDCYKNSCKKNEEKEEENEDEKKDNEEEKKDNECDEKKNEDSDDDLVSKVTKIVERILAEKDKKNEDEDKKDNEDKEEKQNSLSVAAMMRDYSQPQNGFETRAERIAESNKKYGL